MCSKDAEEMANSVDQDETATLIAKSVSVAASWYAIYTDFAFRGIGMIWAWAQQTNKMTCALNEDSDQS